MKKTIVVIILSVAGISLFAQKTGVKITPKATAAQPKAPSVLKTPLDSLSYALGISLSNFYKAQGITSINTTLLTKAINDTYKKGKPLLTDEQINTCISNYIQKLKVAKAAPNKQAGAAFLATNKTKPGIVTLPSGLQYEILKEGNGPKPTINDKIKCHYHGTLIDGTVFDSSVERGEPLEIPVGGVIPGWIEALQLMPVGSKWKLFIPSNLAYGDQETGKIKAGSALIFEVELLDIVK